jgi:hypothetical protein
MNWFLSVNLFSSSIVKKLMVFSSVSGICTKNRTWVCLNYMVIYNSSEMSSNLPCEVSFNLCYISIFVGVFLVKFSVQFDVMIAAVHSFLQVILMLWCFNATGFFSMSFFFVVLFFSTSHSIVELLLFFWHFTSNNLNYS